MTTDSPDSPPPSPPSGSPRKRRKITAPEIYQISDQCEYGYEPPRPGNPVEEDESGSPVCGICLSEGGKSISGHIDSCDHYFCFVCILEWAKVESRCPMCKQRFTSIRRPPKLGVFSGERIVNVPQRDQIYHLSGNATTTRSDPYAETRCMVCRNMTDESLLLLCDLCDSAAHTYCVGLGHTVPEGDWFCHDCAVSRAEHEKSDQSVDNENENVADECVEPAAADQNILIFDIVKDADEENSGVAKTHTHVGSHWAVDSCARTLGRCRNVQSRIQVLRDNWSSLRDGSLKFPSGSGESSARNPKRHEEGSQFKDQDDHVGLIEREKNDPYDTKKAWKMLKMAKIDQKIRTENGNRLSKVQSVCSSSNGSKVLSKIRSENYLREKQQRGVQNLGRSVMKMKQKQIVQHPETERELPKQKQHIVDSIRPTVQRTSEHPKSSVKFNDNPLHRKALVQTNLSVTRSSADYTRKSTSNKSHVEIRSYRPVPSQTKVDLATTSSSKPSTSKCLGAKIEKKNENVKTEIQSLVKLNLKLLSKDRPLGVIMFKEVARISTHSILAACGLEHLKLKTRHFRRPVCNHRDPKQQHESSMLLQYACQECFNAFVTDVVRSIMKERTLL